MKVIIDATTGTIVDLAECYIIDADLIDDSFTESEICDLAVEAGVKIASLLEPKEYTVWVGGVEANDYYLTRDEAQALANEYISDEYDDVVVVRISKNDEA
jgi:hypothetical protein